MEITDGYVPKCSISTNFYIIYGTNNVFWALMPLYR